MIDRHSRFGAVFDEAYEPVRRYVRRRVGDTESYAADDVVANTMLVVWRRLEDVPDDAVVPWCLGVARRVLANRARANVRGLRLVHRIARERLPVPPVAPDDLDPALTEALATLRREDRELLRLWAWEDLQPRDIAIVLGISPNAASIRLHRAKQRLRVALDRKTDRRSGHLQSDETRATSRGRAGDDPV